MTGTLISRAARRLIATTAIAATMAMLTACNVDTSGDTTAGDTAASEAAGKASDNFTTAQKNAIASAKSYLSMGSGFSKAGLIQQLTSKGGRRLQAR